MMEETNKELVDIISILTSIKYKGKLYSPALWGVIEPACIKIENDEIVINDCAYGTFHFDKFGRFKPNGLFPSDECQLFPSKTDRNWEKFSVQPGDVLEYSCSGGIFSYVYRDRYSGELKIIESEEGYSHGFDVTEYHNTVFTKHSDSDYHRSQFAAQLLKSVFGFSVIEYLLGKTVSITLKTEIKDDEIVIYNGNEVLGSFYLGILLDKYANNNLKL